MEIVKADRFYGDIARVRQVPVPDGQPEHLVAQIVFAPGMPPTGDTDTPVVRAVVDEGRWIVHCPFCPSAQIASQADRRFYCVECFNRDVSSRSIPVEWPGEATAIEQLLTARPSKLMANWYGESLAQLREENAALGVPGGAS